MKLSIVIPLFNKEERIITCLDCLNRQRFKDFEIIVVEDGPTDHTEERVNEYFLHHPNLNHTHIHIEHKGSSEARKMGIAQAQGDYIGFIDGDDEIPDEYYATLLKYDADIICSDVRKIQDGKEQLQSNHCKEQLQPTEALQYMLNGEAVYQYLCNKVFKKELFQNINYPPEMIGEDFMLTYQLLKKATSIYAINDNAYIYHVNQSSQSREGFNHKHVNMHNTFHTLLNEAESDAEQQDALKRYILLHDMAILVAMSRNQQYDPTLEKEILMYVKENKDDFLKNSHYDFKTKTAVRVASLNYPLFKHIAKVMK